MITLLRHTRVAAEGRCYGRWDPPLARTFPSELRLLRRSHSWNFSHVFVSPSLRCRRLAEALPLRAIPSYDERLLELHFGAWEGQLWTAFDGPQARAWAADPWAVAPPGGESVATMWARVSDLHREVNALGGSPLLITHAGVIRIWLALDRRLPPSACLTGHVPHGRLLAAGTALQP